MRKELLFVIPLIAITSILLYEQLSLSTEVETLSKEQNMMFGHLTLVVYDQNQQIKQYVQTDNLVVDLGLDTMTDLVFPDIDLNGNTTDSEFDWVGIGTGNTTAAAGDTAEEANISGCPRLQDATVTGTTAVSGETTTTISVTFSGANCASAVVGEAVLANTVQPPAGSGEILARQIFSDINLGAADTLAVTWDITIT
jgi:hypothetical protein